jgi:hypothetical protein
MTRQTNQQLARKRACGLLMLAALLVSSMAQDASSDTVRVKVVFEGEHVRQQHLLINNYYSGVTGKNQVQQAAPNVCLKGSLSTLALLLK